MWAGKGEICTAYILKLLLSMCGGVCRLKKRTQGSRENISQSKIEISKLISTFRFSYRHVLIVTISIFIEDVLVDIVHPGSGQERERAHNQPHKSLVCALYQ